LGRKRKPPAANLSDKIRSTCAVHPIFFRGELSAAATLRNNYAALVTNGFARLFSAFATDVRLRRIDFAQPLNRMRCID
jgi:hypothetical protein